MFAAVRVESGHRQARVRKADGFQRPGAAPQIVQYSLPGDQLDCPGQRNVPAEKEHLEIEHLKQGERIVGSGQPAKQFGVADVVDAGGLEGFLVDRRGGQRVHLAGLAQGHRAFDELVSGAAGRRLNPAECHLLGVHVGQVHQVDDAGLVLAPAGSVTIRNVKSRPVTRRARRKAPASPMTSGRAAW